MATATALRPASATVKTQTTKTPQQDPLDAAIDRATRWGVRVLASGRVKSTTQRFWIVSSASDAAHPHLVFRLCTERLSCDCRAGRAGRTCQHVASVVMHETVQADRRRRLAEEMEEAAREEREAADTAGCDRERWLDDNMGGACIDACRGWS